MYFRRNGYLTCPIGCGIFFLNLIRRTFHSPRPGDFKTVFFYPFFFLFFFLDFEIPWPSAKIALRIRILWSLCSKKKKGRTLMFKEAWIYLYLSISEIIYIHWYSIGRCGGEHPHLFILDFESNEKKNKEKNKPTIKNNCESLEDSVKLSNI